jgi:hypothetical protein
MTTGVLVTRKDVMRVLGIGGWKMRSLVKCGVLTPVHHVVDEHGRPLDRAMYRKSELEAVAGMKVEV